MNLVVNLQTLKDRNVGKMYPLGPDPLPKIDAKNMIFVVRPSLRSMNYVAQVIQREEQERRAKKDFYLYFMPRKSLLCEKHLEMKGVLGSLKHIGEFACSLFPLDKDLLSMEWPQCYKELYLDGDPTVLYQSALALISLQRIYGRIPRVCGKGDYAEKLWQMTKKMGVGETSIPSEKGVIDQLIILERPIDLMTPLATQLTYEGLIDEVFGISNTTVHIPGEDKLGSSSTTNSDSKILFLNSSDELFAQLRDKNFNAVGQQLSRHAETVSAQMERPKDNMSDMKKFVERLPLLLAKKQALADHTSIAERIKDATRSTDFLDALSCEQEFMLCSEVDKACAFIEDAMAKEVPLSTVLRLICMQCVAGSGLKPKVYDYYKRELVQTYGVDCLLTIGNLEKAGLLKLQTGSRSYAMLRKALNLTVDDFSEVSPRDISYVHSFYAPLTIRLVEHFLRPGGWLAMSDVMSRIPGATFEDVQRVESGDGGVRRNSITSEVSTSEDNTRTILVFFVGGCTFAEVSALRFLSQQPQNNVEFLVATTKVVNKERFLEPFIERYSL